MCYTYDDLSRVINRTIKDMSDNVLSEETFTYDAAGNLTGGSTNTIFAYDTNNRLVLFNSSYAPAYAYKPDQLPEILDEKPGKGSNFVTSGAQKALLNMMALKPYIDSTKELRQALGVAACVGFLGMAAKGHGGTKGAEEVCFGFAWSSLVTAGRP